MTVNENSLFGHDLHLTRENRNRLKRNDNLLYWYGQLYKDLFAQIPDLRSKRILEVGSGTSPLKLFFPQVITSDILRLDYLDLVLDCHEIDNCRGIQDHSIDIISLTNVLHHLRDPICFLCNATKKLKHGGQVFLVEPYFSVMSYPLYKFLHHEPASFDIVYPGLNQVEGPLSTSNQAVPHMIFFSQNKWQSLLAKHYDTALTQLNFFSSLSYMMTGGISRIFPVPFWIYRRIFSVDRFIAIAAPRIFASFFVAKMVARSAF